MLISKRVEFSASHVCRSPGLSDEDNLRVYGPEANPLGHGHNFILEVTLEGSPDPITGMVLDLKTLKEILEAKVLSIYDHRHLNREVAPFDHVVPTPENIAIDIWNRLKPLFTAGARLHAVRIEESADLWVEYRGEA